MVKGQSVPLSAALCGGGTQRAQRGHTVRSLRMRSNIYQIVTQYGGPECVLVEIACSAAFQPALICDKMV